MLGQAEHVRINCRDGGEMSEIVVKCLDKQADAIFSVGRLLCKLREKLSPDPNAETHFFEVVHVQWI